MVLQNSFNNLLMPGLRPQLGSDATGDIYFRNGLGFFTRLPVGANGDSLTVISGLPSWQTGASPGGAAGGDLTGTFPNPTIANSVVSFAKLQNIPTGQLLGRNTGGTGAIEALSAVTVRSLLSLGTAALVSTGTASGNVPVLDGNGQLLPSVLPPIALTSIQTVADQTARLALNNVQPGDSAKQLDNGLTYILSALPASTDANWVSIGDTNIVASDIVSGILATARLATGTANATTFLRGDQTWAPVPYQPLPGVEVTTASAALAFNTSVRANHSSLCTLTLPTVIPVDTIIRVVGVGAGGWRVAQNAGQQIHFGNLSSTVGNSGRLDSTHRRDCVEMICTVANTELTVISSQGNIDVIV